MENNRKILILSVFLLLLVLPPAIAYKQNPDTTPVHQYIAKEALDVWTTVPNNIKNGDSDE